MKNNKQVIQSILSFKTTTNIYSVSLFCYVQSLLYERMCDGYKYGDIPSRLDTYVKEFQLYATTQVKDAAKITSCRGIFNENNNNNNVNNNNKHNFLSFCEGEFVCGRCEIKYCKFCLYEYKKRSFISIRCKKDTASNTMLPTEKEMRKKLIAAGTDVPNAATYVNVVDLYEDSIESGALSLPNYATNNDNVKFPLEPSSVFDVRQNVLENVSESKTMIDFNHFIHDDNISALHKSKLVSIMASLVDLPEIESAEKKIGDGWKSIIPVPVINIANNSRIHDGERLCKRAIRHSMDVASPAMLESTVTACTYKNHTAIRIQNKVKPSMKSLLYSTETCFNDESLIASACSCKAGCRTK